MFGRNIEAINMGQTKQMCNDLCTNLNFFYNRMKAWAPLAISKLKPNYTKIRKQNLVYELLKQIYWTQ